ncbi:MAG: metallophosphoesterase, partial [Pseudomonadota bacterium]
MAGRIDFSSVRRKSLSVAVLASSIAAFALPGGAGEAGSPSGTFLTLSDVHYDGNAQDVWGSQQETSRILWTRAQDESKRLVAEKNPGFVIYLGDLPAHNMDAGRRETQFRAVLDGLQSIVAGTGKRLIYVPGNNDSVAPDYCAFTEGGETPFDHASDPKAWPVVNSKPADFINRDNLAKGYYSVYPLGAPAGAGTSPNLRVVTLNSVIFNPNYGGFAGTCVSPSVRQDDANGQIEWLRGELQAARDAGHKVLIAMHVPPGVNGYGSWHNPDAIV